SGERNSVKPKAGMAERTGASTTEAGRILIHPPLAEVAPLSARHERGEDWGEGLVPSNCRALLRSPLPDPFPTSPPRGEGIDRGLGGGIKMRPAREGEEV